MKFDCKSVLIRERFPDNVCFNYSNFVYPIRATHIGQPDVLQLDTLSEIPLFNFPILTDFCSFLTSTRVEYLRARVSFFLTFLYYFLNFFYVFMIKLNRIRRFANTWTRLFANNRLLVAILKFKALRKGDFGRPSRR